MPKIETYKLKIGESTINIEIRFSTKTEVFYTKDFPGNILSVLNKKSPTAKTYKELILLMDSLVEEYIPYISFKEKVIIVYATLGNSTLDQFEKSLQKIPFGVKGHVEECNKYYYKYGFLNYHNLINKILIGIQFRNVVYLLTTLCNNLNYL